mmetsp:Transcript_29189/g.65368  ORF Transcript_29189/g.65368 Transcript_29189/m.65368 type:complete len:299 (-) Transcript_29189:206-1102(-)
MGATTRGLGRPRRRARRRLDGEDHSDTTAADAVLGGDVGDGNQGPGNTKGRGRGGRQILLRVGAELPSARRGLKSHRHRHHFLLRGRRRPGRSRLDKPELFGGGGLNAPRRKQLGRRRRRRLRFLRAGQGARQGAPRRGAPRRDRRGAAPGGRNLVHEGGQLGRGRRGHGMGRALGRSLGRSAAPAPASAARGRASAVSRRAAPLALGAVLRSAVLRNAVLRRSAVLPTQKGPVPKALDGSLTLAAAAARVLPDLSCGGGDQVCVRGLDRRQVTRKGALRLCRLGRARIFKRSCVGCF